jgi:hypothetical protein
MAKNPIDEMEAARLKALEDLKTMARIWEGEAGAYWNGVTCYLRQGLGPKPFGDPEEFLAGLRGFLITTSRLAWVAVGIEPRFDVKPLWEAATNVEIWYRMVTLEGGGEAAKVAAIQAAVAYGAAFSISQAMLHRLASRTGRVKSPDEIRNDHVLELYQKDVSLGQIVTWVDDRAPIYGWEPVLDFRRVAELATAAAALRGETLLLRHPGKGKRKGKRKDDPGTPDNSGKEEE